MSEAAKFPFTERVEIHCFLCDTSALCHEMKISRLEIRPNPSLPDGWKLIDSVVVCPNHQINFQIDGKDFPFYGDAY